MSRIQDLAEYIAYEIYDDLHEDNIGQELRFSTGIEPEMRDRISRLTAKVFNELDELGDVILDEGDIDEDGSWVRRTLSAEDIAVSLDEGDSRVIFAYRVDIKYFAGRGDELCEELSEEQYDELLYSRDIWLCSTPPSSQLGGIFYGKKIPRQAAGAKRVKLEWYRKAQMDDFFTTNKFSVEFCIHIGHKEMVYVSRTGQDGELIVKANRNVVVIGFAGDFGN